MVPDEHKKLIVHIRKTTERQKRKKLVKKKELEVGFWHLFRL